MRQLGWRGRMGVDGAATKLFPFCARGVERLAKSSLCLAFGVLMAGACASSAPQGQPAELVEEVPGVLDPSTAFDLTYSQMLAPYGSDLLLVEEAFAMRAGTSLEDVLESTNRRGSLVALWRGADGDPKRIIRYELTSTPQLRGVAVWAYFGGAELEGFMEDPESELEAVVLSAKSQSRHLEDGLRQFEDQSRLDHFEVLSQSFEQAAREVVYLRNSNFGDEAFVQLEQEMGFLTDMVGVSKSIRAHRAKAKMVELSLGESDQAFLDRIRSKAEEQREGLSFFPWLGDRYIASKGVQSSGGAFVEFEASELVAYCALLPRPD